MRAYVLGFVAGVAFLQSRAGLPDWRLSVAALLLLSMLPMLANLAGRLSPAARRARPVMFAVAPGWKTVLRLLGHFLGGFACGVLWATLFARCYLAQQLPRALEGRDIVLVGVVDSLPVLGERGLRFNFAVERALDADGQPLGGVPDKVALGWYAQPALKGRAAVPVAALQAGERWQLTVRLQRPHGNANPYGFDYEVWLLEQGLRATGYVRGDGRCLPPCRSDPRRLDTFVFGFGNAVERLRGRLRARILEALPNQPYAGVIVALVIGDQRAVGQRDWQIFARTGVSHLISISGLHITMIAGLLAALTGYLWRHSFFTRAQLPLRLPAQKAAALAGVLTALLYVLLAGFGVPAQRTLYMLAVVALAMWLNRTASVSHVLCLALLAVLLFDPWALLWPGFWLSFLAVAAILLATGGRLEIRSGALRFWQRWRAGLWAAAHIQYVLTLALVPVSVLLFGQVSLVAPVANAVAIPVISLLVTPLALLGAVLPAPLSAWLLTAAHMALQWLAGLLAWLSAPPLAIWSAPVPSLPLFLLATLGMLWLLMPRGWPLRPLGLLLFLPLLLERPERPAAGALWVTALDVGQGSALLVETAGHRLLYDTGPAYAPLTDGGNRVIVPYLKARGINRLDGLVISHNDNDHAGGALSLMSALEVGWTLSSLAQDSAIVRAAPAHRPCAAGQHWVWDAVRFEVLHPEAASYGDPQLKPNARSCTLKISTARHSVLLAGDIEAAQERQLLASMGERLRASVLLAPHHGSGTSSTAPFLAAVRPQAAIFQLGYRNRYRHPKAEVWERYAQMGIQRWRNDEAGAVSVRIDSEVTIAAYRDEHRRYWYGR